MKPWPLGLVAGLALLSTAADAHEIKVLLDRMSVPKGDQDAVFLSWGHRLPIGGPTRGEDLEQYRFHTPSGSIQGLATDTESDQRNIVHLEEEGLYTAEAVRKPAIMTVFTLGDQHVHFVGPKTEVREGALIKDSYRSHQSSKALVTSGIANTPPKPIGHTLEIVPTTAPGDWVVGQDIPFQVLFQGQPLIGELFQAKPIEFKPDDVWTWVRPTDQQGQAVLRPDRPGTWLIKATYKQPAPADQHDLFDADSWTATLVLEIQAGK